MNKDDKSIMYSFKVSISSSRKEMGIAAGKCAEELLCTLLSKKETVRVIMASAPSQDDILGFLQNSIKIDWSRIEVFHMDEYVGVSPDDRVSFSNYLQRTLFDKHKVKAFHRIITNTNKPIQDVCDEYSKELLKNPIDLVFLGIGENGHIAFNDPSMADLKDPKIMKEVSLDEVCRMQQVHDGCFPTFDAVPKTALTLTVPTLMSGAHLVCTVPTLKKNSAVKKLLLGPVSVSCPSTAMRLHPDCNLFLDNESGRGIPSMEGVETILARK
ncbi:MAG: 6-phosphogluconolactonase [Sphaerochaetaceae bacterium]